MSDNPNITDPNYVDWTDEELDALASVNPATLADVQVDARASDVPGLAGLLEATEE